MRFCHHTGPSPAPGITGSATVEALHRFSVPLLLTGLLRDAVHSRARTGRSARRAAAASPGQRCFGFGAGRRGGAGDQAVGRGSNPEIAPDMIGKLPHQGVSAEEVARSLLTGVFERPGSVRAEEGPGKGADTAAALVPLQDAGQGYEAVVCIIGGAAGSERRGTAVEGAYLLAQRGPHRRAGGRGAGVRPPAGGPASGHQAGQPAAGHAGGPCG